MADCFDNLLVGCPNGGGLFLIHSGAAYRLDRFDTTGLSVVGSRLLRGIQPATVMVREGRESRFAGEFLGIGDVHDVMFDEGFNYVVSTQENAIAKIDSDGHEVQRWTFPGEPDSWHINSLCRWNGRIVFSAFGSFRKHREYKGVSAGSGFVQDLHTGERLIEGLSQPHSLLAVGDNLLLANSEQKEIAEYSSSGQLLRKREFDGYTRGLLMTDECLFVGLSASRNIAQTGVPAATLVAVRRTDWQELGRVVLPVAEIYDIERIDSEHLPVILSGIADHVSAVLAASDSQRSAEVKRLAREAADLARWKEGRAPVEDRLDQLASQLEDLSGRQLAEMIVRLDQLPLRLNDELKPGPTLDLLARINRSVGECSLGADATHAAIRALANENEERDKHASAMLLGISDVLVQLQTSTHLDGVRHAMAQVEAKVERFAMAAESVEGRMAAFEGRMTELLAALEGGGSRSEQAATALHGVSGAMSRQSEAFMRMQQGLEGLLASVSKIERERASVAVIEELETRTAELNAARARVLELASSDAQLRQEVSLGALQLEARKSELSECRKHVSYLEAQMAESAAAMSVLREALNRIEQRSSEVAELHEALTLVNSSRSMRLTLPLRKLGASFRGIRDLSRRVSGAGLFVAANISRVPAFVRVNPSAGAIWGKAKSVVRNGGKELSTARVDVKFNLRLADDRRVKILTTHHCLFVAESIKRALSRVGISSDVIFDRPTNGYEDVPHFVICPQMFPVLPGFYVAFQMEQSVSSRWFTDEYLRALECSFAILDYSIDNIKYLKQKGLHTKQINFLPIGYQPGYAVKGVEPSDWRYDVIFYGDPNNERRQRYLNELSKVCRVKVVSEVFGDELQEALAQAPIIVNIHYYQGALLETTRVWESLSLGKLVVSERASDQDQHTELEGIVDFVDVEDIPAMVARVQHWVENPDLLRQRLDYNRAQLAGRLNRFDYFFYRFLLATENMSFDEFWNIIGKQNSLPGERVCLTLPECPERTEDFEKDNKPGFMVFPGLRHSLSWVGCAMSYKYMLMLARQQGMAQVTICEDDVEFPEDFEAKWQQISEHLDECGDNWDIFSGLMADLGADASVLAAEEYDGRHYVVVDRLISMVFNCYRSTVFDIVANWDETNHEVETNAVDRYLENYSGIKVVTTHPFLVGHKEELHSTIWGIKNTQYSAMIAASSERLRGKIESFKRRSKWWPSWRVGKVAHVR